MTVEEELGRLSPAKDTVLTVGVFDGVHLGHKYLISQLIKEARRHGYLPGVVTFRQHPQEITSSRTQISFLTDLEEREALLRKEGVELIACLSFTPEVARLSAREFVGLLQKHLRMRSLIVGPDFALGRGREGNLDVLRRLGKEMGFDVMGVSPIVVNGEVVSSTAIRKALAQGDARRACVLAGRPFSRHGKVVRGSGRGGKLGFPTANIDVDPGMAVPADGIYASWAYINGRTYPAMTYIGRCPTFNGTGRASVEVFIIDYSNNLYGRELKVDIIEKVRSDKRFDSVDDLKKQMAEDVRQGRALLCREARTK